MNGNVAGKAKENGMKRASVWILASAMAIGSCTVSFASQHAGIAAKTETADASETETGAAAATKAANTAETEVDTGSEAKLQGSDETEADVASASEMLVPEEVTDEGMVPVSADELKDGTYEIDVNSSSSMFEITSCSLTVEDGAMTAEMIMGGTGYLYVYPGTAEEAAEADEQDYIPFEELEDGTHKFTFPVEALDEAVECAAFSKRKEKWYGRQLCFVAESLPREAFLEDRWTDVSDLDLEDGSYTAEVSLEGGSGRASVTSPAELTVADGSVTARIEWSSSNYDYMIVDGEKYLPVNTEGNSVFEIPVTAFDVPITVLADTTAMSKPYEIEYKLTFDSETIEET